MSRKTLWIHIFGSLIFLSLPVIFSPDLGEAIDLMSIPPFRRDLLSSVLLLTFFYINYFYLVPKFFFSRHYIFYFSIALFAYIIITFLPELLVIGRGHEPHMPHHINRPSPPRMSFLFIFGIPSLKFGIILIFSLMLRIKERLKQIETEKTNAELSYLKAQINPHFLFNTLNSIYSLAILKSDKTADALVKLSDMMRYVLNDGNSKFVPLEKELNYISSYIELQKMRLSSNVRLSYACEGIADTKKIAPLILIPFIENAFKHGVNSEEESDIEIKIIISDVQLQMFVKNRCVTTNNNTLNRSGLGIENTRLRLQLLYPDNHALKIHQTDNYFIVNLVVNIHD